MGRYERRRNALVRGLNRIGWPIDYPRATMFAWAKITTLSWNGVVGVFQVIVARCQSGGFPGIGFGEGGDDYVRFALVENEHRIFQAVRGIRQALKLDGDVMQKTIQVGLIGFGTVGTGVVKILQENGGLITKRVGVPVALVRNCGLGCENRSRGIGTSKGHSRRMSGHS